MFVVLSGLSIYSWYSSGVSVCFYRACPFILVQIGRARLFVVLIGRVYLFLVLIKRVRLFSWGVSVILVLIGRVRLQAGLSGSWVRESAPPCDACPRGRSFNAVKNDNIAIAAIDTVQCWYTSNAILRSQIIHLTSVSFRCRSLLTLCVLLA